MIVKPDTVVRWHREGFRHYWRSISIPGPGRPRLSQETRDQILRLANENGWRVRRIQGELSKIGIDVSLSAISRYLPKIEPDPYLRSEMRVRRLLSVGALVGGRVVGHLGTRVPISGDSVADTIAGMVDPDYRGLGLMSAMGGRMGADYDRLGIVALRHIATGAHDRTQRSIAASGGVATGVLLGHIPAGTDYRGIEHGFGKGITWKGLVRYFVLFVIDLKTRRIEIAGIVASPSGAWMRQIARNLADAEDGFLLRSRYLIHDRDPLFTKDFRDILDGSGVP